MAEESGRPISISLTQVPFAPQQYKTLLDNITRANEDGVVVRAQVAPRAVGLLLGLQASMNPFLGNPAYMEIAALPLAERVAAMREPSRRDAILAAAQGHNGIFGYDRIFDLGDPPNYEPAAEDSIAAQAARANRTPQEFAYDLMLADDGRALLYTPFLNYADGNLDAARELLAHPYTVPGLGDGGAHVGTICDASFVTTLLTHWGRDRADGRFELPYLVQQHCRDTARTVGLYDRGVIAPGYRADVNVIDFDNLRLSPPEIHHDRRPVDAGCCKRSRATSTRSWRVSRPTATARRRARYRASSSEARKQLLSLRDVERRADPRELVARGGSERDRFVGSALRFTQPRQPVVDVTGVEFVRTFDHALARRLEVPLRRVQVAGGQSRHPDEALDHEQVERAISVLRRLALGVLVPTLRAFAIVGGGHRLESRPELEMRARGRHARSRRRIEVTGRESFAAAVQIAACDVDQQF
jgi:hypothetical protein